MVLFIWNLLRHARGARYIYKSLLSSFPLGTTGVSSPPWMHMWLQMSLLEIKHSHQAVTEPQGDQHRNSLELLIWRRRKWGKKKPRPTTKMPHSFAGLIAVLWMHTGWKRGRNCKYSGGSRSKILQEICVGVGGLKLMERFRLTRAGSGSSP